MYVEDYATLCYGRNSEIDGLRSTDKSGYNAICLILLVGQNILKIGKQGCVGKFYTSSRPM